MFRKLLIANRGEIACRIARTARRMGLQVATVHSDADRDALHVRTIGESVHLGPAPATESYLHIERVVAAAQRVGADAVHPGYGFLSENAGFAEALQNAGIAFVGPTPQILRDFGDKAAAKRLAQAAGVPVIPGTAHASRNAAEVAAQALEIGLPVLLKAAAGGGGKGIRVVHDAAQLADEIAAAMREGASAFGDPALLVERYLPQGRHVEVQILGDGHGGVWHLWERECSLQRRHQKVVEEAPALALPVGLRQRLLEAAVALGRQVRYRALGTVEFLVTGDAYHFLEVNPRLQVEHPVTEAVTGLDLVELQLQAAAGTLPAGPHEPRCEGHAIELRLYAEDPEHGFLPATGTLQRLQLPADGTRVETGVEVGSVVTPHYDPMLAKLVVHGRDRSEALARARAALAATRVSGLAHNLGFLERLLAEPDVAAGTPDTGTIDRLAPGPLPAAWRAAAPAVAAAWTLMRSRCSDAARPASAWPALTHWRLGAGVDAQPLRPQYEVRGESGVQQVRVCGAAPDFVVYSGAATHRLCFEASGLRIDGVWLPLDCGTDRGDGTRVWVADGRHTEFVTVVPALSTARRVGSTGGAAFTAPLTGKVLELRVRDGDAVAAGQVLLVIESMKMEHRVTAPQAGVVHGIGVAVGSGVERGAVLGSVTVAQEASA